LTFVDILTSDRGFNFFFSLEGNVKALNCFELLTSEFSFMVDQASHNLVKGNGLPVKFKLFWDLCAHEREQSI
jgi:hypothetical protein